MPQNVQSASPNWIQPGTPAVVLAPMEGVTDAPMREFLTELGGLSFCVSEFIRVSQYVLPPKVFKTHVPELKNQARTQAGTPVQIQILGGDPERMAESALQAIQAGAQAIDINFGCPAPTVNKHDGGATLLKYPDRIKIIVSTIRQAVPAPIPVSAKLRLGWESIDDVFTNAKQAEAGGASWITLHARTRMQGYAPPVHWKQIGEVRKRAGIPVVANGDIWTREDFLKCQDMTGCEHFMIGRGALIDPSLPRWISAQLGLLSQDQASSEPFGTDPADWAPLVKRFAELSLESSLPMNDHRVVQRVKQWVRMVKLRYDVPWFETLKTHQALESVFEFLESPASVPATLA